MKVLFDTEACKKNNQDIDVLLYLISLAAGAKITTATFEKARVNNFLTFLSAYRGSAFPEYVELSKTGEFLVETVMSDSHLSKDNSEERYVNLANKLREIFPAGKKPGYAYTWRDSTSCIVDRLKKFVMKYGNHSDEDIIKATKEYVSSFNGNYQYMQLLKYFIWKNKVTGGELVDGRIVGDVEKQSQLAAYLEDSKEEVAVKNNWDIELK